MVFRATVDLFVAPYISGHEFVYPAYMSTAGDVNVIQRHFSGYWRDVPAALLRINCSAGANYRLSVEALRHESRIQ